MAEMFRVTKDTSGKLWAAIAEVNEKGDVIAVHSSNILGGSAEESIKALDLVLHSVAKLDWSEEKEMTYQTVVILREALAVGDILDVGLDVWKEAIDKKDLQQRYKIV